MIRYEMDEKLLRYTFGDHPPVAEVPPGSVLVTSTQDCFAGAVRTVDDLPSAVCPAFNPVTGPFFVPGAEPGDTIALHFRTIEPSRDWGMSSTFPHFGARDCLAVGLLVGVGGQLGDLVVSVIKRDVGVKDMGAVVPGHGGVLDRIDSLVYVAPLFFHYVRFRFGLHPPA